MKIGRWLVVTVLIGLPLWAQQPPEVADAPANPPTSGRIAPSAEPGTPLTISGTVVGPDAKPVAGVIVYAYHTDAKGCYVPGCRFGEEAPRLRGWVRTDAKGHFEFQTIKPAPYPNRDVPAHVHITTWGGGSPRQWFMLEFQNDPLLPKQHFTDNTADYTYVAPLVADSQGRLHCEVTIHLRNSSNFSPGR